MTELAVLAICAIFFICVVLLVVATQLAAIKNLCSPPKLTKKINPGDMKPGEIQVLSADKKFYYRRFEDVREARAAARLANDKVRHLQQVLDAERERSRGNPRADDLLDWKAKNDLLERKLREARREIRVAQSTFQKKINELQARLDEGDG